MAIIRVNHRFFLNLKWTLLAFVFLTALFMTVFSHKSMAATPAELQLPPAQETEAFKLYKKQPKSEVAKINFLFYRFNKASAKVLYDGHEYEMPEAMKLAKSYFYKHYSKESAEYWIQNFCYKTDAGNVILLKLADGQKVPARDIALEELKGSCLSVKILGSFPKTD